MSVHDIWMEMKRGEFDEALAKTIGLTIDELYDLGFSIEDCIGNDEQIHCKIIRFTNDAEKYKGKLPQLENNQVRLDIEDWNRLMAINPDED